MAEKGNKSSTKSNITANISKIENTAGSTTKRNHETISLLAHTHIQKKQKIKI